MGPAWAACADIGGRYAGTLGGAMNMMANLLGAVAAVITGALFKANLHVAVFVILSCSFWMASLCWWGVDVTRPLEQYD
jgi:hypothetical protein